MPPAIQAGLAADDPLMRRATVESLEQVDVAARLQLVAPLLRDPVRGVRLAAANTLADVRPVDLADPAFREALELAFDEYVASERVNADRAESWVNLAGFHFRQGRVEEAVAAGLANRLELRKRAQNSKYAREAENWQLPAPSAVPRSPTTRSGR